MSPLSLADDFSPRLSLIDSRKTLIVGVKTDYPPWGFYDPEGNIIGLEPDLAKDIADRLGVKLQLERVTSSNRIGKLESGAIDLLIATMSDTEKRRQQTGIIEPSYYSSGATILAPKNNKPIQSWAELYGRPVCLSKNAYFNRELIERFLLKAQEFEGTLDNLAALKFGKCIGWIYDDSAIANVLKDPRWANFYAPLSTIMSNPWAMAVQSSEKDTAFGLMVSNAISEWHRSGKLIALENKWGIRNSQFLIDANVRWNKKDPLGRYTCKHLPDNTFPPNCLSHKSITSTTAIRDDILSSWGINFPPIYDDYSKTTLLKGISLTLLLSVLAIVGSLLFGLLAGTMLYRLPKRWAWPFHRINDMFRMTPPLLNLYIIFFGLGGLASLHYGIQFNAIAVAVVVFSLYAGSSNAALFSQALYAAREHHPDVDFRRLFSSAFQHAYEGINANSVNIVKAVGLASMIAVPELISAANSIIADYGTKAEMMTFLLFFYFLIVYVFILLLNGLQRWVTHKHG
jgi:polar amino acid transport system substrate-binding protein